MESLFNKQLATIFVVLMFIVSGILKVIEPFTRPFPIGVTDYGRISKKFGISKSLDFSLVFLAGVVELLAAYFILEGKQNVHLGVAILMTFTTLVTIVFYTFPFKFKPFLSNLSVIAALWLLLCR